MTISENLKHPQYWLIRLYYFLFLGAFSFIMPFLPLFYRRQGLSGTQIGLLGTISAVIGVLIAPSWGRWSDQLLHPKRLLQGAFLGSAISYLILSYQDSFMWIAIVIGLNAVLISGIEPISDSMALKSGNYDKRVSFGSIRLWGSLGWASVVYLAGVAIENHGIRSAFWGYAGFVILTISILNFTRPSINENLEKKQSKTISNLEIIQNLVKDSGFLGLTLALMVLWFVRIGVHQFQAIYMNDIGAGESVIGLVNTITALVELPSMLWADRLVNRFQSHRVIKIAFILFALQSFVIVILPAVPMFLFSGVLNGIAFSFFNVALVVFIAERAPLGQTATLLALFSSTLRGMIQILAAPLSGLAYDRLGAYWLYVIALAGCLIGFIIFQQFSTGRRSQRTVADKAF